MDADQNDAHACALAALSVCEALLVALVDHKIIPGGEAKGVLNDAATAHRQAGEAGSSDVSMAAAAHIRAMMARNGALWDSVRL